MERDIRDLFKENEVSDKEIPQFHREEFTKKLNELNQKSNKNNSKNRFKMALSVAAIIVFTTVLLFPKNDDSEVNKTLIQIEVAKFEKEYLKNINKEWQQFLAISNDSILIKKYEVKLKNFDTDYKKITKNLEKNPNNINVLEALINNLQRRLELIKNIKEHIKELNQKNTSNETIYI